MYISMLCSIRTMLKRHKVLSYRDFASLICSNFPVTACIKVNAVWLQRVRGRSITCNTPRTEVGICDDIKVIGCVRKMSLTDKKSLSYPSWTEESTQWKYIALNIIGASFVSLLNFAFDEASLPFTRGCQNAKYKNCNNKNSSNLEIRQWCP